MLGAEHARSPARPEGLANLKLRPRRRTANHPRDDRLDPASSCGMNAAASVPETWERWRRLAPGPEIRLVPHYHGRPDWERRIRSPPAHVTSAPRGSGLRTPKSPVRPGRPRWSNVTGPGRSGSDYAPSTAATPPSSTWDWRSPCSCSARVGWSSRPRPRPSLWFVALVTFPLVFRRPAPVAVFLVVSAYTFAPWLVAGRGGRRLPADRPLPVTLESVWVLVVTASVIVEVGVWWPRRSGTPGNHLKSFVFLGGLALPPCWLAWWYGRRAQLDWLAGGAQRLEIERDQQASLAAAAERSRIAREMHDVVSPNLQVVLAGRRRHRRPGVQPRARRRGDPRGLKHGAPRP